MSFLEIIELIVVCTTVASLYCNQYVATMLKELQKRNKDINSISELEAFGTSGKKAFLWIISGGVFIYILTGINTWIFIDRAIEFGISDAFLLSAVVHLVGVLVLGMIFVLAAEKHLKNALSEQTQIETEAGDSSTKEDS